MSIPDHHHAILIARPEQVFYVLADGSRCPFGGAEWTYAPAPATNGHVPPLHAAVLRLLARRGPMTATDLAWEFGKPHHVMVADLAVMVRAGKLVQLVGGRFGVGGG